MRSAQPSNGAPTDTTLKEEKEKRPPFLHHQTSATIVPHTPLENLENETQDDSDSSTLDILLLIAMFIMLIWPWVFFGVVWATGGIRMNNHVAKVVMENPQATSYFVTLVSNIFSLIIGFLFSSAVVRYAKEWVAEKNFVKVFDVVAISAFKSRSWPWGVKPKNLKRLFTKRRWIPGILLIFCIACFTNVTSSLNSLLTPAPFNRNVTLQGQELDFTLDAPECLTWFNDNKISNNCDWELYKGLNYTNCLGENQMVDVLESGRGNILSLVPENSQSLTFSQLGGDDGLHFLGSIRGILPIGPNGVPAFDTLGIPSPFSDPVLSAAMLSYNYTLHHQGLNTDIKCAYDTQSPIEITPVAAPYVLQYSSTCNGSASALPNVTFLAADNSNNLLTYWACKSSSNSTEAPIYSIYLHASDNYGIGDITCNITSVEAGIFGATYKSLPGVFSLAEPVSSSPLAFSGLMEYALIALGSIISEGQSFQANDVAESVITFGVKSFGQQPYAQTSKYLQLWEAMIQGILDYEATYIRLIYSSASESSITPIPSTCNRAVTGSVSYQVIGWSVRPAHIGFLMPMTIVNLASLVIFIIAMRMARQGVDKYDPTDPLTLMYEFDVRKKAAPAKDEWKDEVVFGVKEAGTKKNEGQMSEKVEANDNNRDSIAKSG